MTIELTPQDVMRIARKMVDHMHMIMGDSARWETLHLPSEFKPPVMEYLRQSFPGSDRDWVDPKQVHILGHYVEWV